MDISQIIDQLKQDRDALSIAILALEKLGGAQPKRRGRPRKQLQLPMDLKRQLDGMPFARRSVPSRENGTRRRELPPQ